MHFVGHAFVDWDDTIAENIRYFQLIEQKVSERIAALTGFGASEIRHRGEELNVAVAKRIGLVKESFGLAWSECYREFSARVGLAADPALVEEILQECRYPYEVRQELLPGAPEALHWLHGAGFEVTIWTAGDDGVQRRKVQESGLATLAHRIVVVPGKTPARLVKALEQRAPERSFVIGNSLHSDISPALTLGIMALHISKETWAYDKAHVDLSVPHYRKLASIADAAGHLVERFEVAG